MKNPLESASAHLEGKAAYGAAWNLTGLLLNPLSLQTKRYPTRRALIWGEADKGFQSEGVHLTSIGAWKCPPNHGCWKPHLCQFNTGAWDLAFKVQAHALRTNLAYQATTAVAHKAVAGWWHLWAEKCVVKPLPQTLLVAQAWTGATGSKVHMSHIVNDIRHFGRK